MQNVEHSHGLQQGDPAGNGWLVLVLSSALGLPGCLQGMGTLRPTVETVIILDCYTLVQC